MCESNSSFFITPFHLEIEQILGEKISRSQIQKLFNFA